MNPTKRTNKSLSSLSRRVSRARRRLSALLSRRSSSRSTTPCTRTKETNNEVDKLYIEFPKKLNKETELYNLLVDYFNAAKTITEQLKYLDDRLEKDHLSDSTEVTVRDFEEEKRVSGEDGSFRKTLLDLETVKECSKDDSFGKLIDELQKSHDRLAQVHSRLKPMLEKIKKDKRKAKTIVVGILCGAITLIAASAAILVGPNLVSCLIRPQIQECSAISAGPLSKLNECVASLKRKKDAMRTMDAGTDVTLREVDEIMEWVKILDPIHKSLVEAAENAVDKKSPVHVAVEVIKKHKEPLTAAKKALGEHLRKCDSGVRFGTTTTYSKMKEFLSKGKSGIGKLVRVRATEASEIVDSVVNLVLVDSS